jgi:hypothetical protein
MGIKQGMMDFTQPNAVAGIGQGCPFARWNVFRYLQNFPLQRLANHLKGIFGALTVLLSSKGMIWASSTHAERSNSHPPIIQPSPSLRLTPVENADTRDPLSSSQRSVVRERGNGLNNGGMRRVVIGNPRMKKGLSSTEL